MSSPPEPASEFDYPPFSSSPDEPHINDSTSSEGSVSINSRSTRSSMTNTSSTSTSTHSSFTSSASIDSKDSISSLDALLLSTIEKTPRLTRPLPHRILPRRHSSGAIKTPFSNSRHSLSPIILSQQGAYSDSSVSDSSGYLYSSGSSAPVCDRSRSSRKTSYSPKGPVGVPEVGSINGKRRRADSLPKLEDNSTAPADASRPQTDKPTLLAEYMRDLNRSSSIATTITRASSLASDDESMSESSSSDSEHTSSTASIPNVAAHTQWRIIHSANSMQRPRLSLSASTTRDLDTSVRQTKRQKLSSETARPSAKSLVTSLPATVRKAQSLRSEPGPRLVQHSQATVDPHRVLLADKALPNGVPIIAPPLHHRAPLPSSRANVAKKWIYRFLEREQERRQLIRLNKSPHYLECSLKPKDDWQKHLDILNDSRVRVIRWFLEVLPTMRETFESRSRQSSFSSYFSSFGDDPNGEQPGKDLLNELLQSPQTRFHAAWIFLEYFYVLGNVEYLCDTSKNMPDDMQGQAISRFDSRISNSARECRSNGIDEEGMIELGKEMMLWDMAVACMALSVKYHHDVLPPFYPIWSDELEGLSSHGEILYEHLEEYQRLILHTFSHELGSTPQILLDAIWVALPELCELLGGDARFLEAEGLQIEGGASGRIRDNDWVNVLWKETWACLFASLLEPDVLRFSLSHLTCTALIQALRATLMSKLEHTGKWNTCSVVVVDMFKKRGMQKDACMSSLLVRDKWKQKVERLSEGVRLDIQTLCGLTDRDLANCQEWMKKFIIN